MKIQAYAVYDEKAEAFLPPFFVAAPGQAIRLFTDGCQDRESPFGKHPTDYKLYRIGEFDDSDGSLQGLAVPTLMVTGAEVTNSDLKVQRA